MMKQINYKQLLIKLSPFLMTLISFIVSLCVNLSDRYNIVVVEIVVAFIPMIFTILIIAIKGTNESLFGKRINDIRKKRLDFHFSFSCMISIAITIFAMSSIFQIFSLTIAIWGLDITSILYSILFLHQELPFITNDKNEIKKIIEKSNKILHKNKDMEFAKDSSAAFFDDMILNVMLTQGIKKAYKMLKNEDSIENIDNIVKLISLENGFYFELCEFDDQYFLNKVDYVYKDVDILSAINMTFSNIEVALDFKNDFNILSICGNTKFYYLITRNLFAIQKLSKKLRLDSLYKNRLGTIIRRLFFIINYGDTTDLEFELIYKILNSLLVYSISGNPNEDKMWFLRSLRDNVYDSGLIFGNDKDYYLFVSFYLFYLCECDKRVTISLKEQIIKFLNEENDGINSNGKNWIDGLNEMFRFLRFNNKIDFFKGVTYIYNCEITYGPWYIPHHSTSWSSEYGEFSIKLIYECLIYLLCCDPGSFDYRTGKFGEVISKMDDSNKNVISRVIIELSNDNVVPSNFIKFYFSKAHFHIMKNNLFFNDLNDFNQRYLKDKLNKKYEAIKITKNDLEKYKNVLIAGFNRSIDKISCFNTIAFSDKFLKHQYSLLVDTDYCDKLIEGYAKSFECSVPNILSKNIEKLRKENIKKLNNTQFKKALSELKIDEYSFRNNDSLYYLYDVDKNIADSIKNLSQIEIPLSGIFICKKNSIKTCFRVIDELCIVDYLTDEQINFIIDRDYQIVNGLYKYIDINGTNECVFYTREEIYEKIKKKYIYVRLVFCAETFLNKDEIVLLEREL